MNPTNARLLFALVTVLFHLPLPAAETGKPKPPFQYKSEGIEVPAATADEPRVKAFGPDTVRSARQYLDDGAHHWVREKSCIACHSTGVYMVERSALAPLLGKPSDEVRADFIESIPKPEAKADISAISSVWRSSGLASWDRHVSGKLSEDTARSLQWTMTRLEPGGFFKTYKEVEIPYISTTQALRALALCGEVPNLTEDSP